MADTTRWLTTQEAAEQACCDPKDIRRAVRRGYLRADRMRGELRFLESWIDAWLVDQLPPENDEIDLTVDTARLLRELSFR